MQRSSENPASARLRPAAPSASIRGRSRASSTIAARNGSTSPDGTSTPAPPTISREPADGGGDHGAASLHRLQRDHPEALAERRDDDDRGLLDRALHRRDVAEEADGVARRLAGARSAGSSGPVPARSSVRSGTSSRAAANASQQHLVALDRDQPADAEQSRRRAA